MLGESLHLGGPGTRAFAANVPHGLSAVLLHLEGFADGRIGARPGHGPRISRGVRNGS